MRAIVGSQTYQRTSRQTHPSQADPRLFARMPSRGLSASLFDTREHAMEANRWVLEVMRDRPIAPNPPSVMAGRVVLAALAEG